MKSAADELTTYLVDQMPDQTPYNEVAQFCRHIFCTLDGLPEGIASLALDRVAISDAFSRWVAHHYQNSLEEWYKETKESRTKSPLDHLHWSDVIDEIYTSDGASCDSPLPFQ